MTFHSREFEIEYDGGTPPLPQLLLLPLTSLKDQKEIEQWLPAGCYLMRFKPLITQASSRAPDLGAVLGVLRIEHGRGLPLDRVDRQSWLGRYKGWTRGSGELYAASRIVSPELASKAWDDLEVEEQQRFLKVVTELRKEPAQPIVLPHEAYRFYFRVTELRVFAGKPPEGSKNERRLRVWLEPYRYEHRLAKWMPVEPISVSLERENRKDLDFLMYEKLEVRNNRFSIVGNLDVALVSEPVRSSRRQSPTACRQLPTAEEPPVFRGASVRVVDLTGKALEIGAAKVSVRKWFRDAGVALRFPEPEASAADATRAAGGGGVDEPLDFEEAEGPSPVETRVFGQSDLLRRFDRIESGMVECRGREWRESWDLFVLLVPGLRDEENVYTHMQGLMFDDDPARAGTRRACAVAVRGADDKGLPQLIAHELGHCFGLYHDDFRPGLMVGDPTEDCEETNKPPASFSELDRARLKHLPDPWLRPDGLRYSQRYSSSPIELIDLAPPVKGLALTIEEVSFEWNKDLNVIIVLENKTNDEAFGAPQEFDAPQVAVIERPEAVHLVTCKVVDPGGRAEILGNPQPPWYDSRTVSPLRAGKSRSYSVRFEFGEFSLRDSGRYALEVGLVWVESLRSSIPFEKVWSLRRVTGEKEFLVPH